MPSDVEEIEAILYQELDAGLDTDRITGIPEAAAAIVALRSQDRGAWEPSAFRVGRQVPRNVYRGDAPMFMAATEAEAAEMVVLLNAGRAALTDRGQGEGSDDA